MALALTSFKTPIGFVDDIKSATPTHDAIIAVATS